jgi:hypothetical protein
MYSLSLVFSSFLSLANKMLFKITFLSVFSLLWTSAIGTACFCLQNDGSNTRIGLNRLACQRAGHQFHENGCWVATVNGCSVPPRGLEIDQLVSACRSLGSQWSSGYLNCNC